jgi:hypothetical protein
MAMHQVRFKCVREAAGRFTLRCEVEESLNLKIAPVTFKDERAIRERIAASGIELKGVDQELPYGCWIWVTSRQLDRIGFQQIPAKPAATENEQLPMRSVS